MFGSSAALGSSRKLKARSNAGRTRTLFPTAQAADRGHRRNQVAGCGCGDHRDVGKRTEHRAGNAGKCRSNDEVKVETERTCWDPYYLELTMRTKTASRTWPVGRRAVLKAGLALTAYGLAAPAPNRALAEQAVKVGMVSPSPGLTPRLPKPKSSARGSTSTRSIRAAASLDGPWSYWSPTPPMTSPPASRRPTS